MKRYITAALTGTLLLGTACKDNPVAPNRDQVVAGSKQTLQSLVTGIVSTDRGDVGGAYGLWGSIMARDVVVPTGNETRYLTEFYEVQPDPSDFIGGSQWTGYYDTIRYIQNLLTDQSLTSLSAGNQAAARGFLRTLQGLEYIRVIEYRNQNGAVIQGPDPTKVDPIRTKQAVLAYTVALLDSAAADLNAASTAGATSVPFTLPSGYQLHGDYTLVSNLILLNRGLKGQALVMAALDAKAPVASDAPLAITALNAALADAPSPVTEAYLNKGPWYQYNPNAPENAANPLPSATTLLTDNFVNSIMPGDARAAQIIPNASGRQTVRAAAYTGAYRLAVTDPTNSANQSVPRPMVRNARFYLLRAQAEIATGDLVSANRDINVVHTVEGGLPPYPAFATAQDAINAVLYEYRYSFVLQAPLHLDALREYGMLNQAYVSQAGIPTPGPGSDALVSQLPITQNETNARNGNVTPQP